MRVSGLVVINLLLTSFISLRDNIVIALCVTVTLLIECDLIQVSLNNGHDPKIFYSALPLISSN